MMRPTIPIAALMVVTAVDHVLTTNSVPSVNATLEILVSASVGFFAKNVFCPMRKAKLQSIFTNAESIFISTSIKIIHPSC